VGGIITIYYNCDGRELAANVFTNILKGHTASLPLVSYLEESKVSSNRHRREGRGGRGVQFM